MTIMVILGFGALAIDISYVRFAQAQAQDIADAASQAGLYTIRTTSSEAAATQAINDVVSLNQIVGSVPTVESIEYGIWDYSTDPPTFTVSAVQPNAVRVTVGRVDDNAVPFFFGNLFGFESANVSGTATSATRALHVILVMDITGSWHGHNGSQTDFLNARAAAIAFLDVLELSYGPDDKFGMSIFTGRYAWEYSPMTLVSDEVGSGAERAKWELLNVASKSTLTAPVSPGLCPNDSSNNFGTGAYIVGGCFPDMPREYQDESGTDHTTGMSLAELMFEEQPDQSAFRAMVVLTDGVPNGLGAHNQRAAAGYTEARWREYQGVVPHNTDDIRTESKALTETLYDDLGVNTWTVAFVKGEPDGNPAFDADDFLEEMPTGIGYFTWVDAGSSGDLPAIFEDIAKSLPQVLVQ
jgi:hypothetical protein